MAKITFIDPAGEQRTVQAEPGSTVMEAAIRNDIPGIDAECGGACSCATCHVYVDQPWFEDLPAPSEDEEDLLYSTLDQKPTSRLSCQILLSDELDGLSVTIAPSAARRGGAT